MTLPRPRPEPLTDEEQDELEDRLMRSMGDVNSFSELDGFFTGLLCAPAYLLPTQYFGLLIGWDNTDTRDDDPTPEYHAETAKLMLRHWHDLAGRLARGEFVSLPLPRDTDELAGEWWSQGFLAATKSSPPEEWEEYFESLDEEGLFEAMEEFVAEQERPPEERELTGEARKALHQELIDAVNEMYRRAEAARRPRS